MRRRLLNLLTVLSLLLCVAAVVLWIRSYWVHDAVRHVTTWRADGSGTGREFAEWAIGHQGGRVAIMSFQDWAADHPPYEKWPGWHYADAAVVAAPAARGPWQWLGFWYARDDMVLPRREWHKAELTIPYWLPTLMAGACLGAAGSAAWRASRRRRRIESILCERCGYDLRASPGRCPECGTAAATPTDDAKT